MLNNDYAKKQMTPHAIEESSKDPSIIHESHMLALGRKRNKRLCTTIRHSQLELLAFEINEKNVEGNVAELGVHTGDFAQYINIAFPNKKLYLFDTFEGFNDSDAILETQNNYSHAEAWKSHYAVADTDIILRKMKYPELCVIKKGWFPSTAEDVNDIFSFVHLDADLYAPIYAGLKWFYPRLSFGGYILVHDYNNQDYRGAKAAVRDFCAEMNISYVPLCDTQGSVVIYKTEISADCCQVAEQQCELEESQKYISYVHQSVSWRITKPLRKIIGYLRKR